MWVYGKITAVVQFDTPPQFLRKRIRLGIQLNGKEKVASSRR